MHIDVQISELEAQLEKLRAKRELEVQDKRQSVVAELCQLRSELETILEKAQKLARKNDLVFFYHDGYEFFGIVDSENWTGSNCETEY